MKKLAHPSLIFKKSICHSDLPFR